MVIKRRFPLMPSSLLARHAITGLALLSFHANSCLAQRSAEQFETIAMKEIHSAVIFDPKRFGLPRDPEATLLLNTTSVQQSIQIKCEQSVAVQLFTVIEFDQTINYSPNPFARVWVGICKQEAKRIRTLAVASDQHVLALKNFFRQRDVKRDFAPFLESVLTYSKDTNSRGAEVFYFPAAVVDWGVFPLPTVAFISRNQLQAIVVQIAIPPSCMTPKQRSQIPVCADPKSTAQKLAERIYSHFGE